MGFLCERNELQVCFRAPFFYLPYREDILLLLRCDVVFYFVVFCSFFVLLFSIFFLSFSFSLVAFPPLFFFLILSEVNFFSPFW